MDRNESRILFGFFSGLAFALLVAALTVMLIPAEQVWIGITFAALLGLGNLAQANRLAPSYNVAGKVVVGIAGFGLTFLTLLWFMSWAWCGIFTVAAVLCYSAASMRDLK